MSTPQPKFTGKGKGKQKFNPNKSKPETAFSFTDGPEFFEDCRLYNEAKNRDRYLKNKEEKKRAAVQKGLKTRAKNKAIKEEVERQTAAEEIDDLSFLPLEYRDPSYRIGIKEYVDLLNKYTEPRQQKTINTLYKKRSLKK